MIIKCYIPAVIQCTEAVLKTPTFLNAFARLDKKLTLTVSLYLNYKLSSKNGKI